MYNHSLKAWAVVALACWPAPASAGWLGLRNDTPAVLVVQQSHVVNNKVTLGRPLVLYPGEVNWDSVVQPCVRTIAVYDPRQPLRPLYENKVPCGGPDLLYLVKPAGAGLVQFEKTNVPEQRKGRR
jgi:hypothetical protein